MRDILIVLIFFLESLFLIDAQILFPNDDKRDKITSSRSCINPKGERGQCISIRQCEPLLAIIQQTPLTNEIKTFIRGSRCNIGDRNSYAVCCPEEKRSLLPSIGSCGKVSNDKIYGGVATAIDEFPWTALLEYTKANNNKGFHCGGTLINDRYILTAAHCLIGKAIPPDWNLTGVRLGEWNTSSLHDCDIDDCAPPAIDFVIEKKIPHENYNPNAIAQPNDIALLRLSKKVSYSSWIQPACLPSADHLQNADFDGISMDVTGWGKTKERSSSDIKLKARVSVVNLSKCNSIYSPHLRGATLSEKQMCAGGTAGVDSCKGDSGGPLISVDNKGKAPYNFLAGIVSFGPSPCGLDGFPGVYTRVGGYISWIENNIAP